LKITTLVHNSSRRTKQYCNAC